MNNNKLAIPVGKVSGVLLTIFGSIGVVGFGIPIILMTILGYATGVKAVFHTIGWGFVPLLIISIIALINGNKMRKRLRRFERYTRKLNKRYYCQIQELSAATGQTDRAAVKDLQKMIQLGMFPEGHLDEQNVYFMLNHKYYEEYIKLQQGAKMKALEEQNKKKHLENHNLTQDERSIINDGRRLIKEIKHANDLIPGEELSNKLYKLEDIAEKIFEYVEGHPDKITQIKRLTEYFLPTTVKLADTYAKLDYQPVQGKNILTAKKEIEETMDTIYDAFENLLDGLFEDVALDISTDISVLETIFTQEGLTNKSISDDK